MMKFYSKPRKKRLKPEAMLQVAVVQYLMLNGVPDLLYHSVPNEGKRTPANGAHLKRLGMLPGVGDLFISVPGGVKGYLELKAPGEAPSQNQVAFQDLCRRNGMKYSWCDNIDHALTILKSWGALRSHTPAKRMERAA